MKPPIANIDDLITEWEKDSVLDDTEPGKDLMKVSRLHAKYLAIFTHHNLKAKSAAIRYAKLKKLKWEYFSGALNNPEDLTKLGWEPMQRKILRADVPLWIDADDELNDLLYAEAGHKEIASFCTNVLKEINQRTWQLRTYIDWFKFSSGA